MEGVAQEHEYPGWFFDQRTSAYWYYDSYAHAYHLYQEATPSSTSPQEQQQKAQPELATTVASSSPLQAEGDVEAIAAAAASWPSWHFDEGRSVHWHLCTSHLAYFIHHPLHAPPGKRELPYDAANGEMHECQGNSPCFCETHWSIIDASPCAAEPLCSYQNYECDVSMACVSSSSCKADVSMACVSSSSCKADEIASSLPSGWVEDFLIDWYLGGSSRTLGTDESTLMEEHEKRLCVDNELTAEATFSGSCTVDIEPQINSRTLNCCEDDDPKALQQQSENDCLHTVENIGCSEEDTDEYRRMLEAWQAQYGQVVRSDVEAHISPPSINLWNWNTLVPKGRCKNKGSICLLGQLAQTPTKLHPSSQHQNGFIKTTCVFEVNLDLVKVSSGEIYRLRQPSTKYLSSVAMYDSSNPTRGWNFPCLMLSGLEDIEGHSENVSSTASKLLHNSRVAKTFVPNLNHQRYQHLNKRKLAVPAIPAGLRALSRKEIASVEERGQKYRDRAKERRKLHSDVQEEGQHAGGHDNKQELCSADNGWQEESKKHLTAKHMLERMGWCEGESLGNRKDGLIQPLQETGNNGRAGIGWVPQAASVKKEKG